MLLNWMDGMELEVWGVMLDGINQRYGRGVLRLAAEGFDRSWQMRRGNLSPGYTTSWDGLLVVRAR